MNARTLVLTPWYLPYRVVSWEDAITLVYLGKVEVVTSYAQVVRSPSVSLALPAVIRMKKRISTHRYRIRFSRVNVFMRDGFRCMYCGRECTARELTFDHVVPRSQGGRTEWINILSACNGCNTLKGNRTPAQAGMAPIRRPFKPDTLPMRPQRLDLGRIPEEWRDYCINLDTPQTAEVAREVVGAAEHAQWAATGGTSTDPETPQESRSKDSHAALPSGRDGKRQSNATRGNGAATTRSHAGKTQTAKHQTNSVETPTRQTKASRKFQRTPSAA